jgi:DNA-binding beta-propeller fold protein YncE
MANFDGGTLSELLAGCTPETCNGQAFDPAGADLNSPYGIALDGSGNVWVTNSGNNSVSEFIGLAAPTSVPALCLKEGHSVSCLP